MSGKDVLRERIARAMWDEAQSKPPSASPVRSWDEAPCPSRESMLTYADAVIAALRLTEDWDEDCWDGGSIPIRRWATPWERIEEDA